MPNKSHVIAMIPARIGSTRLAKKNLALINGKPLIAYAILAAKESGVFDRIIVNSDCDVFKEIAVRYDVEFYLRPKSLGKSDIKADDVVLDFIENHATDIVVWLNTTSPLQTGDEICKAVHHFLDNDLDTLITVGNEQVHSIYKNQPINFKWEGKFAQTQDLIPVQPFVYSVMMWKTELFHDAMKEKGHAFFIGKMGFYPVGKLSRILIKNAEDLRIADYIIRAREAGETEIKYDELVKHI